MQFFWPALIGWVGGVASGLFGGFLILVGLKLALGFK